MTIMEQSSTERQPQKIIAEENGDANLNEQLIDFIANQKDAFFKSQQRDEEDLSLDQKRSIVQSIFESNRSLFLHRYGKYLDESQLCHISMLPLRPSPSVATNQEENSADYINVQINDLKEKIKLKQSLIKNRRFNAMQKLLSEGSYFSNTEMQSRSPFLFEQMVGQYMDDKQRKELQESSYRQNYDNANFSSFLMEQIRTVHLNCRYMVDEHINDQEEEEEDEEEMSENGDDKNNDEDPANITQHHKERLEKEFRSQMMQNFLMGKDKEFFDYSTVDNNENYDMSVEFERDQEDRYFEEED